MPHRGGPFSSVWQRQTMQVENCYSLFHFLFFLLAGISNLIMFSFFISKAMLCSSGQKTGMKRTIKTGLSNIIFAFFFPC